MKREQLLAFAFTVVCGVGSSVYAQQSAAESASALRAQLADVQAKQSDLQTRLQDLGEALKPENIQNSLAGVGSTHPEELRDQRRRQLEQEKAGVNAQLEKLAVSQRRLESAIAQADAAAYQQSARPATAAKGPNIGYTDAVAPANSKIHKHRVRHVKSHPRSSHQGRVFSINRIKRRK